VGGAVFVVRCGWCGVCGEVWVGPLISNVGSGK